MIVDAMGLPFRALSSLRSARAFHPGGVQFAGTLVRLLPEQSGLPLRSCDVSVRVSKGIGVPSGLPDVAGVALRLPPIEQGGRPWDVLLAGSATGPFGRMVPWPSMSWNSAHLSSLMPYKHQGRLWWLRARITRPDTADMNIDDIRTNVVSNTVSLVIEHAGTSEPFEPIAVVHSTALTSPADEIDALQELRVVQTGLQLLTGFLLILPFQDKFAGLPAYDKAIYMIAMFPR
ncbi:DUF6328 family protein [Rhodococcoides fascians]|uniref:DUF6328 family protein n=1 Tax=Rhodococcoides fascians TaxID=1828 RepID=UPI00068FB09A|nr:DUF6328 family protein [Rhodococcus fascians]